MIQPATIEHNFDIKKCNIDMMMMIIIIIIIIIVIIIIKDMLT